MLMQFFLSYGCEPEVNIIYSRWEDLLLMGIVWAVYGILYVQDIWHLRELLCGFVKHSKKFNFMPFFVFPFRMNIEFCMKHVQCYSVWKFIIPLRSFFHSFLLCLQNGHSGVRTQATLDSKFTKPGVHRTFWSFLTIIHAVCAPVAVTSGLSFCIVPLTNFWLTHLSFLCVCIG